jgi:glyoxylase-like metal-dependent hydrolase (beta-lactamase superfamily II)
MYFIKIIWICLMLSILIQETSGRTESEIPIRTQKLSDRVLFIKTGGSSVMSNITALSTSGGIVMIDSHYNPEWCRKIRKAVERIYHCQNFLYLIYSHAGVDHMGGSQVFADAVLIGHDHCISRIDNLHQLIQNTDVREGLAPRLKIIREQIEAGPTDAALKTKLEESLLYWSELVELLMSGFKYTKPSITFNDRLTLHMGDLSLRLCYCTPGYSDSDILIHVPEENLLIVGDIFVKDRVPLLNEKTDIDRWVTVFTPFIKGEADVQHIISCHGGLMTIDDVKRQIDYISDLWKAVEAVKQKGLTLEQAKESLSFNKRYPHLIDLNTRWVGTSFDLHERNIEQVWLALSR